MARLFDKLVPRMRKRIMDYVASPSFEGWKAIRDINVLPNESLYDVMDDIDRDWPGKFPSAILVARCSEVVEGRLKSRTLRDPFEPLWRELTDPTFWDKG